MNLIIRHQYLNLLEKTINMDFIKVLIGVRRCGKSTILLQFIDLLNKKFQIKTDQIIYLDFDKKENTYLRYNDELYRYLKNKIVDSKKTYYVFLDEIQDVNNFEPIILDLYQHKNVQIFITGSNSYMLSSQIASKFTGRDFQINIYPFSFKEYSIYYANTTDLRALYNKYRRYGGMPGVLTSNDKQLIDISLNGIINSILTKDIQERFQIDDLPLFKNVMGYLFDNIGNLVSANKINDYLVSNKIRKSLFSGTIDKYLSYLCESSIFYRSKRYDIKGKEILKSLSKYYAVDTGLRNSYLSHGESNIGLQTENIVYLELLRRGYTVNIGTFTYNKIKYEIDFIATKLDGKKIYVQVVEDIANQEKFDKEIYPLSVVGDNYEKILIANNADVKMKLNGVKFIQLFDFLLEN
jgi:predicted AAA+ superfamily ATPase